jgi:predicted metal-binding membrane protein
MLSFTHSQPLRLTLAQRLRFSMQPDLGLLVLSASAWAVLLSWHWPGAFDPSAPEFLCFSLRPRAVFWQWQTFVDAQRTGGHFAVMAAAMMLPASVLGRWPRDALWRHAAWLGSYLVVWWCVGLALSIVAQFASAAFALPSSAAAPSSPAVALFCLVAAAYQFAPWRAGLLASPVRSTCCSRPGAHFGFETGWHCLLRCGPFMLALHAVGSTSLVLMAAGALLMLLERWHFAVGRAVIALLLVGAALVSVT